MKPPTRRQVNEASFKKLRQKQAQVSGRQPARDEDYLAWIRTQPCVVCAMHVVCRECSKWQKRPRDPFCSACDADLRPFDVQQAWETEAAHTGTRGLGQKAPDAEAIPLCGYHHRIGKDSHHVLGKKFFEHHGLNLEAIQGEFHRRFAEEAA